VYKLNKRYLKACPSWSTWHRFQERWIDYSWNNQVWTKKFSTAGRWWWTIVETNHSL